MTLEQFQQYCFVNLLMTHEVDHNFSMDRALQYLERAMPGKPILRAIDKFREYKEVWGTQSIWDVNTDVWQQDLQEILEPIVTFADLYLTQITEKEDWPEEDDGTLLYRLTSQMSESTLLDFFPAAMELVKFLGSGDWSNWRECIPCGLKEG